MDEKLRVLKMVEEGIVTAEQGAELMAALGEGAPSQTQAIAQTGGGKKVLRILVDEVSGDRVSVQFPMEAVKKFLKVTGRLPIPEEKLEGVDLPQMMEAISECLDEELEGDLVNVESSDGTKVRIYVEK